MKEYNTKLIFKQITPIIRLAKNGSHHRTYSNGPIIIQLKLENRED